MNKIEANCDLTEHYWTIDFKLESNNTFEVFFYFGNIHENFIDLNFSLGVLENDNIIANYQWPEKNKKYIRSDQKFLESTKIILDYGKTYTLEFNATHNNTKISKSIELSVPFPVKPFESWIWSDARWQAPVAYPADGLSYRWKEEIQNWEQFTEI